MRIILVAFLAWMLFVAVNNADGLTLIWRETSSTPIEKVESPNGFRISPFKAVKPLMERSTRAPWAEFYLFVDATNYYFGNTRKETPLTGPEPGHWVINGESGSTTYTEKFIAYAVSIMHKYKGRISVDPSFLLDNNMKQLPFEKEIVITNQVLYAQFVARLPGMEPLYTKGNDHPNDDPLLKKPDVNFTNFMIAAVTRDNMYLPPDITRCVISNETLLVQYTEEDLGQMAVYQQQEGLGTYCCVVIPKTALKIAFSGTTTKSALPSVDAELASKAEEKSAALITGTWVALAGQNQSFSNEAESIYYTFRSNGSVTIWATLPLVNKEKFEGHYDILEGRVLQLNIQSKGSRQFDFEITDSRLLMKDRVASNNWINCKRIVEQHDTPLLREPQSGHSDGRR